MTFPDAASVLSHKLGAYLTGSIWQNRTYGASKAAPFQSLELLPRDSGTSTLDRLRHYKDGRLQAQQTAVGHVIDRCAQAEMVVILKRDETEWLEHASSRLPHGAEDFSHAVHRSRLRLKCEFDEGTGSKRMLQLQQSTGHGNGLEFGFCAPAVF
jgi:hypothetical protein